MSLARWLYRLAVLAALVAVAVWYLDEDIPDGFQQERKLRVIFASFKVINMVANTLDWLGICPFYKTMRYAMESGVISIPVPQGMLASNDTFDGVPVRVYRPSTRAPGGHPGIVFFHGGAFTMGSMKMYDHLMIMLGEQVPVVIASVEYRLAPETPFPAALEDCEAATKYLFTHAGELGVDVSRVALLGDSAGGNLVAVVSQKLRDDNFPMRPKRQVLIYPSTQSADFRLPSYQQNGKGPGYTLKMSTYFRSMYAFGHHRHMYDFAENFHTSPEAKKHIYQKFIRHEDLEMDYHYHPYQKPKLDYGNSSLWGKIESTIMNPYFSPLLAKDLGNLPDTFIVTVHYDMLRDDGILYAQKLRRAGVKVDHVHVTHAHHGVWSLATVLREGAELNNKIIADIKENL